MRVVLDTNVLVSALLFKKRLGAIETIIEKGAITPCFIMSSYRELQNVLGYEKLQPYLKRSATTADEIVKNLTPHCRIFDDPEKIPNVAAHASDNYILAAAAIAQARYLVTGDKELLGLRTFENIPIVSPQQLLKTFK